MLKFVKVVNPAPATIILAREIVQLKKTKLGGRSAHFGVPYRFYVGTKTDFFDFIEQNRVFDSLGEDLGARISSLFTRKGKGVGG